MNKIKLFSLATLVITTCVSCVTTTEIGLNRDFQKGNFKVGKTTKSQVVDYLGLPQYIEKNKNGTVRFIYPGEALLTGMITGGGNTSPGLLEASANAEDVEQGAKYIFNSKGILIKKVEPKIKSGQDIN